MGAHQVVRRAGPPLARVGAAAIVLFVLVRRVGAEPFRAGVHAVTLPAVVAAAVITVGTTVCSAWRWRVVARALGAGMPMGAAVGAYYRSQFLNSVLPGGIVGDVHRAVVHGRSSGDVGRGLRAVAWERGGGQVVQFVLTALVLVVLPSPVRGTALVVVVGAGGVVMATTVLPARRAARGHTRRGADALDGPRDGPRRERRTAAGAGASRIAGLARTVLGDVRRVLIARDVWPRVAVASALVTAGHTAVFVLATRAAGAAVPLGELLPLALLVQAAMVIPLNAGGWGPREGVAAWVFAAAGYGAGTGVTVTTVYGVLALVAVTPGLAVLAGDAVRRGRRAPYGRRYGTPWPSQGSKRKPGGGMIGAIRRPPRTPARPRRAVRGSERPPA